MVAELVSLGFHRDPPPPGEGQSQLSCIHTIKVSSLEGTGKAISPITAASEEGARPHISMASNVASGGSPDLGIHIAIGGITGTDISVVNTFMQLLTLSNFDADVEGIQTIDHPSLSPPTLTYSEHLC